MKISVQNRSNGSQRKRAVVYAVLCGGLIAAVFLLSTLWVSNGASTGTNEAVNRVSEFYLEELAGRRAQVVSEELKNHFDYIENSLKIIESSDLESQEALRAFLGKVKKLYGVEICSDRRKRHCLYRTQHDFRSEQVPFSVRGAGRTNRKYSQSLWGEETGDTCRAGG